MPENETTEKPLTIEKVKIIEVERINGNVVVTFSDGRVTTLEPDDIHLTSVKPPTKYPPEEIK
jgi:hypothetical protein